MRMRSCWEEIRVIESNPLIRIVYSGMIHVRMRQLHWILKTFIACAKSEQVFSQCRTVIASKPSIHCILFNYWTLVFQSLPSFLQIKCAGTSGEWSPPHDFRNRLITQFCRNHSQCSNPKLERSQIRPSDLCMSQSDFYLLPSTPSCTVLGLTVLPFIEQICQIPSSNLIFAGAIFQP